jgi:hypothetical protein
MVRVVETQNAFGHGIRALLVPGAKICMASGRDYVNPEVGAGSCADHFFAGPVSRAESVESMQTEVERIREICNALSLGDDPRNHHIAMK